MAGDPHERPDPARTLTGTGTADGPAVATGLPEVDPAHYQVGPEIARGGLGRLFRARDLRLDRIVALKQLRLRSVQLEARFRREARITARLQHPGIVPIHEAGAWPNGDPFYAMKLVAGESLKAVVAARPGLDERLALLPNLLAVCEAIAYAHSERVIHRDIKPSNIMLGAFGETVVVDWGLAKQLDAPAEDDDVPAPTDGPGDGSVTTAGNVLGTAPYLPPEQARGEPVAEAADVYALGALLYFVLTGHPPYDGEDGAAIVERVKAGPPPPLEQREPGVPAELAAIVRKAMARAPADRYPGAGALAADLKRFLTGQLVGAHRYSRAVLLGRWLRRHRQPVAVAAVSLAVLAVLAVTGVRRIVRERDAARDARTQTALADARAEARRDQLLLAQAESVLERDPTAALAWLKSYAATRLPDWNEIARILREAEARGVARHLFHGLRWVAQAPDGQSLAALTGRRVVVIALDSGRRRVVTEAEEVVRGLAFSPDSRTLALAGKTGVTLWNLGDGSHRLLPGTGLASSPTFSDDGAALAAAADDGTVWVVELATGTRQVLTSPSAVFELRFSPDRHRLLAVSLDGSARLWDLASAQATPLPDAGVISHANFSPDGKRVTWGGQDGKVRILDVASGQVSQLSGHTAIVYTAELSPDGSKLLSASEDGTARLWDLATGQGRILPHASPVLGARFSPDGKRMVSIASDRRVRLWQVDKAAVRALPAASAPQLTPWFTQGGQLLVSAGSDGEVRVWNVAAESEHVLEVQKPVGRELGVTAEGFLVAPLGDGRLQLWDTDKSRTRNLGVASGQDLVIAVSHDGHQVLAGAQDGTITSYDLEHWGSREAKAHDGAISVLRFAPDDVRFASAGADLTIRVFSPDQTAQVLHSHTTAIYDIAFSPDGKRLASAGASLAVRLWDLDHEHARQLDGQEADVRTLAFSPDGTLLASAGADAVVHLWDVSSGAPRTLTGHAGLIGELAFTPDGAILASASDDGSARLWSLAGGPPRVLAHPAMVKCLAVSRDGRRLVTGAGDGAVRVWEIASGRLDAVFRGHQLAVQRVLFGPGDRWVASAGADRTVRMWPLAPELAPTRATLDAASTVVIGADDRVGTPD